MTKVIKTFLLMLILIIGFNFKASAASEEVFYNKANIQDLVASSSNSSFKQLPSKSNVDLNKGWTINFTGEVTKDKIDGIVIQKDSVIIPITMTIIDNKGLNVKPVNSYEKASKYTLKIFLSNGKKRSMDFTTVSSTSNTGDITGVEVIPNSLKVYYDGDDLKAELQFNRALEKVVASDFRLGGVTPSSASISGSKVTLTFKDGDMPTVLDKAPVITYANGLINSSPTKIDLIKAQGQNAKLSIVSTDTRDEIGMLVCRNADGTVDELSNDQATIYGYEAEPRTTCTDDSKADFWTATKTSNGGTVYITFDTPLDPNSGIKTDDFVFTTSNGTNIKADIVTISGNTVEFGFYNTNKAYAAFTGSLSIRANSSASLRTLKDANGKNTPYVPSNNDIKIRNVSITAK